MRAALLRLYKRLVVRKAFYGLHQRLLNISLWGMGMLNTDSGLLGGEDDFLRRLPSYLHGQAPLVVFDVGANQGEYSARVRTLYPQAQVYAFEPGPRSFANLQSVAGVRAFNLALSDAPGRLPLYDYQAGQGSPHASLYREVIEGLRQASSSPVEVAVTTLDAFVREQQIARIDLLKIDTEGNELKVLLGASDTLRQGRIAAIQFEFNEMNVISRVFMRDFFALLPQYSFYRMLPDGLVPLHLQPTFASEIFAVQNIVALRNVI